MTNRKQPTAISRMKQDYLRLKRDPVPYITAEPLPANLLEWHYVVKGPEDSPYQGGYYHGTLLFPREFPFKPPSIYMLTPNGRFKTNTRLCLSMSDFHPDTWNPTWSVGTILTGLLSFMMETTPTLGSTESTLYEKQQYAKKSLAFNLKNSNFRELFPEICEEINGRLQKQQQQMLQAAAGAAMMAALSNCNNTCVSSSSSSANSNNCTTAIGELANSEGFDPSLLAEVMNAADLTDAAAASNRFGKNGIGGNNNTYFNWHSIYSNLVMFISFVIFALIVNYVIKNLNQE